MSRPDMEAATALRHILLRNGFTPLPTVMKQCLLKGWPRLVIDKQTITKWRRSSRFPDTAIRLDDGLAVIDIDINDPAAVAAIVARLGTLLSGLLLLVRYGNGAKIAIFVRTEEAFGRIHSRSWTMPGETVEQSVHGVEIFGGKSPRYFGAFGECGPGAVYRWRGRSPEDTRLDELPELSKDEFYDILDIVETTLSELSWSPVLLSKTGENATRRVHDLTEDMVFDCDDGVTRTLAELEELARLGGIEGLRCSASWLEGPPATNPTRCIIGATANGCLTIWESATGVTHMPKPVEIDMTEVAAKLGRVKELYNARP